MVANRRKNTLQLAIKVTLTQMKYKHIIWDWNGTLLDDVWLCVEIVNGLLETHEQSNITEDFHRNNFDFPIEGYYRELGFDFEKESFQILTNKFIGTYSTRVKECNLHQNSSEILDHLANKGCTQSILSAAEQGILNEMVTHFGLTSFFGKILGLSDNLARSKVEIGKEKIKDLNADPKEVVYIGDTFHDFEVAEHIGVDSILISHGHHSTKKLESAQVSIVSSLSELRTILDK